MSVEVADITKLAGSKEALSNIADLSLDAAPLVATRRHDWPGLEVVVATKLEELNYQKEYPNLPII